MIRDSIHGAVKEALIALGAPDVSFVVERPASLAHGDYATNAALAAAKVLKRSPREVADELCAHLALKKDVLQLEKIEVAGAGFINFTLSREALTQEVYAAAGDETWGQNAVYADKEVLVEYTSPNLFKPLHIGNLIGNILGESVARILHHSGADVKRINYPSDIGLTIAKGVWGLVKTKNDPADIAALGESYRVGNEAYENDTDAKREIEEINKALYENSNPEWSALRERGIQTSLTSPHELCKKLGTAFDKEFFESEAGPLGREIVRQHVGDVFEESQGAVVYRGEQDGLHTRVFLNSQGLPTYEAKEVGLFDLKSGAYEFDMSLTVTGGEQRDFFAVVFAAIKKIFPEKTGDVVLKHIPTSFLRLTTGKMSSRRGNVITGESLLMDLTAASRERMQERHVENADAVAQQVAVGAIKYAVLKQGSGKDIIFDPEKSLSLEGDSGPYLQYAHTRAHSLIEEAQKAGVNPDSTDAPASAYELERILLHYPEVLEYAAKELEPHYVTTFLTELASAFNSWYANNRVIGGESPSYGLLLTQAVEKTLAKGLHVLGIPVPEEM